MRKYFSVQPNNKAALLRHGKSCLAALGLLSIIVYAGPVLLHWGVGDEFGEGVEFPSPDGKFKAVLFSANGGGGISPYCYDSIVVADSAARVSGGDESKRVYFAGCYEFFDPVTNNGTNGPEIRWLANNQLQIHLSVNHGTHSVPQMVLKSFATSGKISISYVVSENAR